MSVLLQIVVSGKLFELTGKGIVLLRRDGVGYVNIYCFCLHLSNMEK